jgi:glycosyltransferase involved in cell wall biosynthesis
VGAIQRRKNQAALVRAFRALPSEWRLVLAGSEGFGAEETLAAIAASPCQARIQVTGYISDADIASWYAKARIFAFPSLDEGFGMPVLEAMAAGVPVIAGNRSSLPEVAGDAASLVDPTDHAELEKALQTLAENGAVSKRLIEAGHERARQFTWEKAVAETTVVYKELL